MSEMNQLNPAEVKFTANTAGGLSLELADGTRHETVRVRQMFPVTKPEEWLSVRTDKGLEIGVIACLPDFPEPVQELLRHEFQLQYFVPRITALLELHEEYGFFAWEVDTDHGRRTFFVKGRTENIHHQSEYRLIITDVEDCKYEIPDIRNLDRNSRRLLSGLV